MLERYSRLPLAERDPGFRQAVVKHPHIPACPENENKVLNVGISMENALKNKVTSLTSDGFWRFEDLWSHGFPEHTVVFGNSWVKQRVECFVLVRLLGGVGFVAG